MMSALSADIIKVRHDITNACDITKACWHQVWCQKADQLHRYVNVAHSWQGKSLNKCQIRISPDILNHTCTFSLTWSSVSHRTARDRREYGIEINTKIRTLFYYQLSCILFLISRRDDGRDDARVTDDVCNATSIIRQDNIIVVRIQYRGIH